MKLCITGHALTSVHGDYFEEYQAAQQPGIHLIEREFKSLPKVRRTDRLSRLCLYTTMSLHRKHPSLTDDLERTGIVLSSKYGPYKVCKEYIEQVKADGYDMGSPALFSATVPNAGVGYICRALQLHGPMTSERGSDGIISAIHMLLSGKADMAYSLAVDEITEALTVLTAKREPEPFSEVCNLIVLESEEHAIKRDASVFGYLLGVQTIALKKDHDHLFHEHDYTAALSRLLEKWKLQFQLTSADIDTVMLSANLGSEQWQLEHSFIRSHVSPRATMYTPKDYYGESFAASFQNSILYALLAKHVQTNQYMLVLDADYEESKISVALLTRNRPWEEESC